MKQLIKRIFGGTTPESAPDTKPKSKRQRAQKETKSAKELATEPKSKQQRAQKETKSAKELATKPKSKRQRAQKETKSAKELATERDEPYISVVKVELDIDNVGAGSFELDWNDKFLANLVRAGYQKEPNEAEHVIVDRWFQDICRHVVLETYEQEQADPDLRKMSKRNLGNGRTEIS